MFEKPEFPVLLFVAALLFFGWPLMEIARMLPPMGRLVYFFGIWAVVVGFNFFLFHRTR
ncbi:MAG: hypothetical protein V7707_06490 [Motiliproteus sp.]